jgi:probable HAF family extracellular repeat protein
VNSYTVTGLGSLGGGGTYAYGLNDAGQVAGISSDPGGRRVAFLWEGGTMTELGTLGGDASWAQAVNASGQVAGSSLTAAGDTHAFLWDPVGGMRDLGTLGGSYSEGNAINDAGQVVGASRLAGGSMRACLWHNGRIYNLGTLPGYASSVAYAITAAGRIVGAAQDAAGSQKAFSWTPLSPNGVKGTMVALGPLAGSGARAANNASQAAGWSLAGVAQPFLWDGAGGGQLPLLPAGWHGYYTYPFGGTALAINDAGTVVGENTVYIDLGEYGYDVGFQAFVWDSGNGSRRLADLINGFVELPTARGVNGSGQIAANGHGAAYLLTPSPVPLGPRYVTATAGDGRVTLAWSASVGADAYNVKRSDDPAGPYVTLAGPVPATAYTDMTAVNGHLYYYVISAVNTWGESLDSYSVGAEPRPVPPAPAGLVAAGGDGMVQLTWEAAPHAEYYDVWRSTTPGGPYAWAGSAYEAGFGDYGYGYDGSEPGLQNGVRYYYVVTAVNGVGASGYSNEASAVPVAPPPPPAPTGLTASPGISEVSLTWSYDPAVQYYNVKRATSSGGPYVTLTSLVGNSHLDTGLTNGVRYYYVVSAVNSGGESPNSGEVSATPNGPPPPAPPTNLTATAGKRKVTLRWTQSSTAGITKNRLYRAATSGGPYTLRATISPGTSFTDKQVSAGVTYYYVVTALKSGLESAHSNEASARPRR